MQYYKLTAEFSDDGAAYEYVGVNGEGELAEQVREFEKESQGALRVTVKEVGIEECLEEQESFLETAIFSAYFTRHYDADIVTVREYSELRKKFKNDPEFRWTVLKEINPILRRALRC